MGDELKVYIPSMVQPVLRLFMQDDSQQKLVTQKVRIVYWNQLLLYLHQLSIEMTFKIYLYTPNTCTNTCTTCTNTCTVYTV